MAHEVQLLNSDYRVLASYPSIAQAAKELGVSPATIRKYAATGDMWQFMYLAFPDKPWPRRNAKVAAPPSAVRAVTNKAAATAVHAAIGTNAKWAKWASSKNAVTPASSRGTCPSGASGRSCGSTVSFYPPTP